MCIRDRFGMHTAIAYGNYISLGMSGQTYCYDIKTGQLNWVYSYRDPLNEVLWANDWSLQPIFFADGKLYLGQSEHSPVNPLPRGAPFVCLNATTGEVIWSVAGMFRQTDWGGQAIIADSIIATMDTYDQQIYAIGKGPSAITVTAPDVSVDSGKSVVLKGTVTDVSAGTKSDILTARFPNGVPAVSDESMSEWMLYVYKQFTKPINATGVPVELFVLDANNNYRSIGTTTTDTNGFYSYQWMPDIPGKYTVYAQFAGSNSYWPSQAITAFAVDDAEATPAPTETPPLMVEQYFLPAVIGLAVAMIIGFAILILLILKKKE